jgi:hypothetical protein
MKVLALRVTLGLQEDKPSTHQKVKWIKMVWVGGSTRLQRKEKITEVVADQFGTIGLWSHKYRE